MIDIQSGEVRDARSGFPIASVGVTRVKYPLKVRDAVSGEVQSTVGEWRLGVALAAERRGTHMSRFIAELEERSHEPLDLDAQLRFAESLLQRLDAPAADIAVSFTWFRRVTAPESRLAAQLESQVELKACAGNYAAKSLIVHVPATSLCPCSKAISERGAHNQRSDLKVELVFAVDAPVPAINRIMELAEESASSRVYPLLKREDEKYVTEAAYDNPAFAEDIVRGMASRLVDIAGVRRFVVEAVNHESIHAHDCYARVEWNA